MYLYSSEPFTSRWRHIIYRQVAFKNGNIIILWKFRIQKITVIIHLTHYLMATFRPRFRSLRLHSAAQTTIIIPNVFITHTVQKQILITCNKKKVSVVAWSQELTRGSATLIVQLLLQHKSTPEPASTSYHYFLITFLRECACDVWAPGTLPRNS